MPRATFRFVQLAALPGSRPAADWEDLGRRAEVPITLVRTSAEWLGAEHPRAAGIVAPVDDPDYGRMLQPGNDLLRAYGKFAVTEGRFFFYSELSVLLRLFTLTWLQRICWRLLSIR